MYVEPVLWQTSTLTPGYRQPGSPPPLAHQPSLDRSLTAPRIPWRNRAHQVAGVGVDLAAYNSRVIPYHESRSTRPEQDSRVLRVCTVDRLDSWKRTAIAAVPLWTKPRHTALWYCCRRGGFAWQSGRFFCMYLRGWVVVGRLRILLPQPRTFSLLGRGCNGYLSLKEYYLTWRGPWFGQLLKEKNDCIKYWSIIHVAITLQFLLMHLRKSIYYVTTQHSPLGNTEQNRRCINFIVQYSNIEHKPSTFFMLTKQMVSFELMCGKMIHTLSNSWHAHSSTFYAFRETLNFLWYVS